MKQYKLCFIYFRNLYCQQNDSQVRFASVMNTLERSPGSERSLLCKKKYICLWGSNVVDPQTPSSSGVFFVE